MQTILKSLLTAVVLVSISNTCGMIANAQQIIPFDICGNGMSGFYSGDLIADEQEACDRARADALAQLDALIDLVEFLGGDVCAVIIEIDACVDIENELWGPPIHYAPGPMDIMNIYAKWRIKGHLVNCGDFVNPVLLQFMLD